MTKEPRNLYDRHQNRRALEKKLRAKERHLRNREENEELGLQWRNFETDTATDGARMGIIVETRGRVFRVLHDNENIDCALSSNIPKELGPKLVIGDKVFFKSEDNGNFIEGRVPRKSVLSRLRGDSQRVSPALQETQVIAANVDAGVIVASADSPAFHPRFVDRYLTICQNGGVEPIVVVNKCDLTEERHPIIDSYRAMGIPVVETSATTGQGLDALKELIRGKIVVLVGNSGVGKSSLINEVIPGLDIVTGRVSEKTGKGRHTTSSSQLYEWDSGSHIIDTPGIRSLGVTNIQKGQLQFNFLEFGEFTQDCKFHNCTHSHEPVCGVKKAVEDGKIDQYRYESYIRMLNE
ncbi:MAG: ribosome small subunit-dependent GTPase A [Candidatus Peregrinibacteria bacterium]